MAAPALSVKPLLWTPEDAAELRRFFGSPTGRRLAFALMTRTASPVRTKTSLSTAEFDLGFLTGFEYAVNVLNELAEVEQVVQATAVTGSGRTSLYPDLDDDSAWPEDPTPK
jgi:hypothetical protein